MKCLKRIIALTIGVVQVMAFSGCTGQTGTSSEGSSEDASGKITIIRPEVSKDGTYNIMDFGAAGDGVKLDSPYIQEAADMCKEAGGGKIIIPKGKYLCAGIRLYSNTTVVFEEGAEILVSDVEKHYLGLRGSYDDYYERDSKALIGKPEEGLDFTQLLYLQGARGCTDVVFFAKDASGVSITGPGKINGQWEKFFITDPDKLAGHDIDQTSQPRWMRRIEDGVVYLYENFRPQMIYLVNCTDVTLNSFTIEGSPFFNVHMAACKNVSVSDLTISSNIHCPNTDGINFFDSHNINISGCSIVSGDDCIALSENTSGVTIDNTRTKGTTCFVRIFNGIDQYFMTMLGIGNPAEINKCRLRTVRDITITNSRMEEGGAFMMVYAAYGSCEDIRLDNNSSYQTTGEPGVYLCIQGEGQIKNVEVNNFTCEGRGAVTIMGTDQESVQNVTFTNSHFTVNPRTKVFGNGMMDPVKYYWISYLVPYNFYVRHAQNVTLKNVEIEWGEADLDDIEEVGNPLLRSVDYNQMWRKDMNPSKDFPAIDAGDVAGLTLSRVTAESFGNCETIRLRSISGYSADKGLAAKTKTINDGLYDD